MGKATAENMTNEHMKSKLGGVQVTIDEEAWLSEIKDCLLQSPPSLSTVDEDVEELSRAVVCSIPAEVVALKPDAYIPNWVSIGPYHHAKSELYNAQRFKIAAARKFEAMLAARISDTTNSSFENEVVAKFRYPQMEWNIRRCYDKYIHYSSETLAWLVSLDAIFVLECLHMFEAKVKAKAKAAAPDGDGDGLKVKIVLQSPGAVAMHAAAIKDLAKMENQIPRFVLEKLLELQLGCGRDDARRRLAQLMAMAFTEMSPFPCVDFNDESVLKNIAKGAHLLEALYYTLVPPPATTTNEPEAKQHSQQEEEQEQKPISEEQEQKPISEEQVTSVLSSFKTAAAAFNLKQVRELATSLLQTLGSLPFLRNLKKPLTAMLDLYGKLAHRAKNKDKDEDAQDDKVVAPSRDELKVPSASDLQTAGLRFEPAECGDVWSIRFDASRRVLRLPRMRLDPATDTVMRNVVAAEFLLTSASGDGGSMPFTRCVDFLNAIIDSADDVKVLVQAKVLRNELPSDTDAANVWNGLGGCINPVNHVASLEAVIRQLNALYNATWRVRIMRAVEHYVFRSWQILSLLAALLLLLFTAFQAFCSVYDCQSWFNSAALTKP